MKRLVLVLYLVLSLPVVVVGWTTFARAQAITFQQIIKNPDDPELNLAFAQQEIAAGRLQQAASALERILLNNPNLDSVRFLYGIILYRLDDLDGARRELALLEGRGLPQSQEVDRIRYIKRIDQAGSAVRISGQFAIGGRFDSNPGLVSDLIANANPGPVGPPVNLLQFPIPGMDDGDDFGFVSNGRFRVEGDINESPGSEWFLQLDGNLVDFSEVDRADLMAGTIKSGVTLVKDKLKITPYVKIGQAILQSERFNERWGGGVEASYRISPLVTVFANVEFLEEDYHNTIFSASNNLRDGGLTTSYVGASLRFSKNTQVTFTAFSTDKNSDLNPGFSYEENGVAINSVTLLGNGAYLTLGAKFSEAAFDQPDGLGTTPFQTFARRDDRTYARAALGAPLQTISDFIGSQKQLPESFQDVVMEVAISRSSLSANSPLIEFENVSGEVLFKKRFSY